MAEANKLKHPKNDNLDVETSIIIDSEKSFDDVDFDDAYFTDNIYVASYLKAEGKNLVLIMKCADSRNNRTFFHFWFEDRANVKPFVIGYHNNRHKHNVNASSFVSELQSIKKMINLGKVK